MTKKDMTYFMSLAYPIVLTKLTDDGYDASIPLLKGCCAYGETREQALDEVEGVKQAWFEIAFEEGWSIPEPESEDKEYSGRFNVRLPKYLHRKLSEMAEEQGTSLNQFAISLLSEGAGRLEGKQVIAEHISSLTQVVDRLHAAAALIAATDNTERSSLNNEYVSHRAATVVRDGE